MNTDDVPSLAVDTMAQKTRGFAMLSNYRLSTVLSVISVIIVSACQATTHKEQPVAKANDVITPVPYLDDAGQEGYRKYLEESSDRAFALSPSGAWEWKSAGVFQSLDDVKKRVMQDCRRQTINPCYFYSINNKVVWDGPAPEELRKLDIDSLGVKIKLPERWKDVCKVSVAVSKTIQSHICHFKDRNSKANVTWIVREGEGEIDAWGEEMMEVFMKGYAADGKKPLPFSQKSTDSDILTLSNGSTGTAVHNEYIINGHHRNVSYVTFVHEGLFYWLAAYNYGKTAKLQGAEVDQIVSSIVFK